LLVLLENTLLRFQVSHCKDQILDMFAKLRKATISFIMSVHLSVCPFICVEQLGSHWMDFHEIWYLSIFQKSFQKIQVSLKSDQNTGYFLWRCV
jgi:heme/copper-type cytochrome/quinol oxidase subunit 4